MNTTSAIVTDLPRVSQEALDALDARVRATRLPRLVPSAAQAPGPGRARQQSLLERWRRIARALFVVTMDANLQGLSTGRIDDLVRSLGADTGISKSEVSRLCAVAETLRSWRATSQM